MSENILEIRDLDVVYNTDEGTIYAVNHLNLSLQKGQTLGIVGETGAGKTTMALSIMQLLPPKIGEVTKGEILFDGQDVTKLSEKEMQKIRGRKISMIFQDPMTSLNPIMTIGDQIAEVLELHKVCDSKKEMDDKVDEILSLVGIAPERKNEFPHQFSGGMKQRVVIAIALACTPDLLLADEPTTALDVTIQDQVLKMMRALKEKLNTAMILITHDFGVVAQTCDSVAVMYAGEVIEYGTVEDIFENENHHPYTVGLFHSIPSMEQKTRRLNPIDGLMPDPSIKQVGCAFYDRCPKRQDRCKAEKPGTYCVDTHMIKCFLYESDKSDVREGAAE